MSNSSQEANGKTTLFTRTPISNGWCFFIPSVPPAVFLLVKKMSYSTVIEKFNPYHDKSGKFCSGDGASFMTYRTKDPNKQYLVDRFKEKSGAKDRKKPVDHIDWKEESSERSMGNLFNFYDRCVEVFGDLVKKAESIVLGNESTHDGEKGSVYGYEVCKLAGYDKKPTVVSHEDFDKLISDGSPEFFRGFSHKTKDGEIVKTGAQKTEEFLSGDYFFGYGVYGSGTYVAKDSLGEARGYGNSNGYAKDNVLRMTTKKDAVIAEADIKQEMTDFYEQASKILRGTTQAYLKNKLPDDGKEKYDLLSQLTNVLTDTGIYAMARGYDGYAVGDNTSYYVIVNRGALIVDETVLSSHRSRFNQN